VGVGNLGTAILGYRQFRSYGLNIVTAFDKDSLKIGKTVFGVEVLPVEKLPELALQKNIGIGIITVGEESAQNVADLMVSGLIKGIWNFAPKALNVPEEVIVENAQLSVSLGVLTSKLKFTETKNESS